MSQENKADPYSNEACVAAASCYPINPDSFLSNLYCRLSGPQGTVPQSANIPRVADTVSQVHHCLEVADAGEPLDC